MPLFKESEDETCVQPTVRGVRAWCGGTCLSCHIPTNINLLSVCLSKYNVGEMPQGWNMHVTFPIGRLQSNKDKMLHTTTSTAPLKGRKCHQQFAEFWPFVVSKYRHQFTAYHWFRHGVPPLTPPTRYCLQAGLQFCVAIRCPFRSRREPFEVLRRGWYVPCNSLLNR